MVTLQATASLSVPALILAGIAAAVVATLAMDAVMARIDEGETPPYIASGVLTETHPDDAPDRLASVVHYVAGALTGPLFVWLVLVAQALVGPGALAVVAATVVCYPLMVGFFALVVLPRSQGLARQRLRAIRRAWTVEAAVYLLVLAPLVGVAAAVL
ncbi:hypothetical protein SAMN04487949_0741 [Halogranum gelatinilyticum]|uniref:Uncharacterized protein n=1 Tax=Halogranum gelatinilyticum TaxID=660521 RepID=A0A1G9Q940_9EURY|nr:hypothetical protein [Halogranum gelatinilyticum]SDM07453.1 hypothetical protein SAMN04487949_0741 [Halogranum gelatinilyticum]